MTEPESPRSHWRADTAIGLGVYLLTLLPVALGVTLAVTPNVFARADGPQDLAHACCNFDGGYFAEIMTQGYWFDPNGGSGVAFFPGYPLLAMAFSQFTNWSVRVAMVVTSNLALAGAFVLLAAYLRARNPAGPLASRLATLGLIGLWPSGFFLRMGYSESLFLFLVAAVLLGFARRWPVLVLAVLAGAATGVRPVGVAATAAVALSVLADPTRGSFAKRVLLAAGVGAIGCWGMFAYMGYLQVNYGNALLFADAHAQWSFYQPRPGDIPSKWARLALAEPIWNAYVPGSTRRWWQFEPHGIPVLGLQFWNPIFFVLAATGVAVGWCRGWLSRPEVVLGLGLVLIPYLTRADEISMGSQARFAAVVVPAFVVGGRLLSGLPPQVTWAVFALLSPLLTVWAAMYAAKWPMC